MDLSFLTSDAGSIRKDRKTFYQDDLMPSLPLPSVLKTIEKYLDSCKAVLTDEEYQYTTEVCKKFLDEEALLYHTYLMKKASDEKNWLERWWQDTAYLKVRQPIMYSYVGGTGPYLHSVWPLQQGIQLERSAIMLYVVMRFWLLLKEEIIPQHQVGEEAFLTMHQLRYLFNTTRIPGRDKDETRNGFKTNAEGDSPTHLIIFHRNRMYRIQGVSQKTGRILTPPEFYKILRNVVDNAPKSYGEGIGALTCLERDTWADARDHMISISERNGRNLSEIEDAVYCFCLDESNPTNYKELFDIGISVSCSNRWNDKSFNHTVTANGGFAVTCEHSPYDGMALAVFTVFSIQFIKLAEKEYPKPWNPNVVVEPAEELVFDLDDQLRDYIRQGLAECNKFAANIDTCTRRFKGFGKAELKKLKVHPDAFVQLCIQLTYMRMHGRPAPTYETASTRGFFRGRTETARTCTPEAVAFCWAMLKGSLDSTYLFHKAHDKFVWLMGECKKGHGCDRYLLGVALRATESDNELPSILTDPAFVKTGGNGNFVLSTSLGGYADLCGGAAAMVENGYGAFYSINHDWMLIVTTAWNSCKLTDAETFMVELHRSFFEVYEMLKRSHL